MSLESRLQELEHALAARQPPKVVEIQCIVCCSRAEVLARKVPGRTSRAAAAAGPRSGSAGATAGRLGGGIPASPWRRAAHNRK